MPVSSASLRTPRLKVLANGAALTAPLTAEIISNNHSAADRFRVTAHLAPPDLAAWSTTAAALLDIQVSLDGRAWTSLIQGEVDQLQIDPRSLRLTLEGRDLTARLIETRTQETFANQTSSQIAQTLAARHSLTADMAATTTPVGAYWQFEHDHITLDSFSRSISEWDLLVTLAGHEGFDVWVTGTTLHFRPPPTTLDPAATLRLTATQAGPANLLALQLDRALTLARDIEVVVKSWNSRQASSFAQTARLSRGAAIGTPSNGRPQRYVYVVPNLTPDAALKLAQTRLAELSRHERVIHAEMPGELSLTPRQQILLQGTSSDFDQVYWIDEITRRLSFAGGFTQSLRARNGTTTGQATSPADPVGTGTGTGTGTGGAPWSGF